MIIANQYHDLGWNLISECPQFMFNPSTMKQLFEMNMLFECGTTLAIVLRFQLLEYLDGAVTTLIIEAYSISMGSLVIYISFADNTGIKITRLDTRGQYHIPAKYRGGEDLSNAIPEVHDYRHSAHRNERSDALGPLQVYPKPLKGYFRTLSQRIFESAVTY